MTNSEKSPDSTLSQPSGSISPGATVRSVEGKATGRSQRDPLWREDSCSGRGKGRKAEGKKEESSYPEKFAKLGARAFRHDERKDKEKKEKKKDRKTTDEKEKDKDKKEKKREK
jgi:hypothetical protein